MFNLLPNLSEHRLPAVLTLLQSAVDELASAYRKTKQVTVQQCAAIAEKIAKNAVAYEQLCEDMKQLEEEIACDAHEVESEAATKQIQLLQGMLQQASNELADLMEKSAQLQTEHEARVNAAAAASAAVERASKEPRMARYAQWLQQVLSSGPYFAALRVSHCAPLTGAARFCQVHRRRSHVIRRASKVHSDGIRPPPSTPA